MPDTAAARENRLLARLPEHLLDALLAVGEIQDFDIRQVIRHRRDTVTAAYFPLSGMISMVTLDDSGHQVEVATIGREGVAGATTLVGLAPLPFEVVWQLPGRALKLDPEALRSVGSTRPLLTEMAVQFLATLLVQTGQNAGCNRMHEIDQRAAKWLLLCLDRVDGDSFALTQEFFAIMLGVTRPRLTAVQAAFARAGFISYARGRMTVRDRPALEEQSCDCYGVIAEAVAKLGD